MIAFALWMSVLVGNEGAFRMHLSDHLGSVHRVVDESGRVVGHCEFDPHGRITSRAGGEGPAWFATSRIDAHEIVETKARWLFSSLGQFGSADHTYHMGPSKGAPNPWELNLYSYALGNPVRYRDPNGEAVETALDVAGAVYDGYELIRGPSWKNVGFFAWSVGSVALPFVPGSWTARAASAATRGGSHVLAMSRRLASRAEDVISKLGSKFRSYQKASGEKILVFGKQGDTALAQFAEAPAGFAHVVGHGSARSFGPGLLGLSPVDLAAVVAKEAPDAKGVLLDTCDAGKDVLFGKNYAQKLADALGKPVWAPSGAMVGSEVLGRAPHWTLFSPSAP